MYKTGKIINESNLRIICYILIIIFLSHFFGDFVLQSDKTSKQKSRDIKVLIIHVLILTCSIVVGLLLFVFIPAVISGFSHLRNRIN